MLSVQALERSLGHWILNPVCACNCLISRYILGMCNQSVTVSRRGDCTPLAFNLEGRGFRAACRTFFLPGRVGKGLKNYDSYSYSL